MITEKLTRDDIMKISRLYGGGLRNEAEIENALYAGRGRSVPRQVAYLWRAILVSHPFIEGDKKTALAVAELLFRGSDADSRRLVAAIIRITKESIADVGRIERLVRYAMERH
ncbi:MAG: hypothetical protein FJY76_01460 [Candidatus Aenigmarchaeota archaeon]|nr:hypothetical protein [Candidatus Aenigmarchaeota archaeon]